MKRKYLGLVFTLLIVSCSKDIQIVDYVDSNKSFEIIQMTKSVESRKINEIKVGEEKHEQLLKWLESNNQNWESTPASYISELVIYQEDFKLLVLKDQKGLVMSFVDKNKKTRQYVKSVNPKELKFLIE